METKDTGSSDWPEDEPQTEQKVTLEDYQQLIIQMRRANAQFQQLCNIPSGELTMLLTLRRLLLAKTFVIPSDIGDALKLSRPAVSRMLHNLERKGYLEMKSSERVKERMGEKDMNQFLYYYSEFCSILIDEIF